MEFDKFAHLDPIRAQQQIEEDLGHSIFDQFSSLDQTRFERQIEDDLDEEVFTNFSSNNFDLALSQYELISQGNSGGGEYIAKAVRFDGMANLSRALPLLGVSSASKFMQSGWIANTDAGDENSYQFNTGPNLDLLFGSFSIPKFTIFMQTHNTLISMTLNSLTSVFPVGSTWLHYVYSVDHSDSNHDNWRDQIYVNAISDAGVPEKTGSGALSIQLDGLADSTIWYGSDGSGENYKLDAADFQFWAGVSADLSDSAVLVKFIAGGKPVDPAVAALAFGPQTVLFSGDHTTFATNQGTGGVFTLAGGLTDAPTSPSD